jgi:predicted dehydrogenase
MEPVQLALVGCGGIAGAHVRALKELWETGIKVLDLVAVCDVVEGNAAGRAGEIEAFQGRRPKVFTDLEEMLDRMPQIEALDICTLHSEHHTLAVQGLSAGRHVQVEKPLGITLRASRKIIDAAIRAQRVLAVAENYRRSPHERAIHRAIRQDRIGTPRTFYWHDVNEGLGKWGWRNFRNAAGAGWVLDGGVHFTDMFRYHLGTEAQQVFACVRRYEPYRYDDPKRREGAWRVDVEDASLALISFDNNVVVQWTWQGSAPGQKFNRRALYGSEGCLDWDSGLWLRDGTHIDRETLIREFMEGLSGDERARLFPGGVTNPISVELKDFADAVRSGTVPEVDGMEGFKAQAICMAVFESDWFNRPVSLREVERCELEGYQREINEALGIV